MDDGGKKLLNTSEQKGLSYRDRLDMVWGLFPDAFR